MDAKLLRNAGIVVAAAALLGALGVATMSGDPTPAVPEAPRVAGPLPPAVVEPASTDEPAAAEGESLSFVVAFRGSGPLARAQALAAQGRETQARSAATRALTRQRAFRGLCFDRFTLGGAEVVLRSCATVPSSGRAQVAADWLARLRDMPSVAYADVNATAAPGARGEP